MYSPRGGGGGGEGAYSTLGRGEGGYSTLGRSEGYARRAGGEESGNFYESDSGVSSLYEPVSFVNQHSLDHSINQVGKSVQRESEREVEMDRETLTATAV